MNGFKLRDLDWGARAALTLLVVVFALGLAASAHHMVEQHQNRDEEPGVSLVDLEGAYHGVQRVAPLLTAIERNHPEGLAAPERDVLLKWLRGNRISEDFDNLDLGDSAPVEVLSKRCLECHSRAAVQGAHKDAKVALEYWEDVAKVAFSKRIEPLPLKVLTASTHAHALTLAGLTIIVGLLLLATRWPRLVRNGLFALASLGLLADIGSWWLARATPAFVPVIVAGGALYGTAITLSLLLVVLDLWLPRPLTGDARAGS